MSSDDVESVCLRGLQAADDTIVKLTNSYNSEVGKVTNLTTQLSKSIQEKNAEKNRADNEAARANALQQQVAALERRVEEVSQLPRPATPREIEQRSAIHQLVDRILERQRVVNGAASSGRLITYGGRAASAVPLPSRLQVPSFRG